MSSRFDPSSPSLRPSHRTDAAAQAIDASPDYSRTILVVDDEAGNRLLLRRLVERLDYQFVEARDGVDALDKAILCRPALIIMDLEMPRMHGLEATLAIREMPHAALAATPLIVATGNPSTEVHRLSLECGADAFLTKPFDLPLLIHAVTVLLGCHDPEEAPDGIGFAA